MTAMGYQATADKDGIDASRQRAQLTQRLDYQHIVLMVSEMPMVAPASDLAPARC